MNHYAIPGIFRQKYDMGRIVKVICCSTDITIDEMKGKNRKREIVTARHLFFYFVRRMTQSTWASMGEYLGNDHTTAIHGENKIQDLLDIKDESTIEAVTKIEELLKK